MATPRLLVLLGSVTPPGRLRRALEQAVARADAGGGELEARLLDLAGLEIALADGRDPGALGDDTEATIAAVAGADVVVIATPVYRGSMTGALKNLLDQLPVSALEGKVVGLVAMGGSNHHFLGAERHLRDVLAFFGAWTMPVAVYLTGADFEAGEPGERAAALLDELLGAAVRASRALPAGPEAGGPRPLAAGAVA